MVNELFIKYFLKNSCELSGDCWYAGRNEILYITSVNKDLS